MYKFFIVLLIFLFSNSAFADEIKLYKKGSRVTFSSDMHCMSNETSLKIINKVKLCEESSKLKLEALKQEHNLEIVALKKKLDLKDDTYREMLDKKDRTIFEIQQVTLKEFEGHRDTTWLTVSVSIVGGIVIGAGVAILANHYAK